MRYVLDTNVISETLRTEPDSNVTAFLRKNDAYCAITAMTAAELVYRVERLDEGARTYRLRTQIDQILALYVDGMLQFDHVAATH